MDVRTLLVTQEAREVVQYGRAKHERYRVVGWGDILDAPVRDGDWLYLPVDDEVESTIPEFALARADEIKKHFKVKGMILAYEAPMVLPMPEDEDVKPHLPFKTIAIGAGILGLAGMAVSVFLAVALGLMGLVGMLALVATPFLIDPALIICLDDEAQTWIEVMTWVE